MYPVMAGKVGFTDSARMASGNHSSFLRNVQVGRSMKWKQKWHGRMQKTDLGGQIRSDGGQLNPRGASVECRVCSWVHS